MKPNIVRMACFVLGLFLSISIHAQENPDPILGDPGYYPGVYIGGGSKTTWLTPPDFFARTWGDRKIKYFSRYIDLGPDCGPDALITQQMDYFADTVGLERSSTFQVCPVVFIEPTAGLVVLQDTLDTAFVAYRLALDNFRDYCADNLSYTERIIVVFGHEMNGFWYPEWGQQPELFIQAFRNVSNILRRSSNKIRMCWMPNQAWGYPNYGTADSTWDPSGEKRTNTLVFGDSPDTTAQQKAYKHYYPGSEYVDWVGLVYYCRNAAEISGAQGHERFIQCIKEPVNFYETYSAGTGGSDPKPMIIGETSFFDDALGQDQNLQLPWQRKWLGMVYSCDIPKEFPNLKVSVWFNVKKEEGSTLRDYRIGGEDAPSYQSYVDTLNLLGCVRLLSVDTRAEAAASDFSLFPNPCPSSYATLSVPESSRNSGWVVIMDVLGRVRDMRAVEISTREITIPTGGLDPGMYFIRYSDGRVSHGFRFIRQ
ncbi:MAG: T9SS type A sorting domain-containing protein [Bacteroidetes bacterium]|nr:T9SS type A sorting domain-containing protein [Bacteroidota bacterium]